MRSRTSQSGFTLLELMVVVALIGILAAVALPSFSTTTRKTKGDSEVASFLAELRVREEQYAVEAGRYLSTGTGEADMFPTTPSPQGQDLGALPATWQALRVRTPHNQAVRCTYTVVAGTQADNAGAIATGSFGYVKPAKNWFYVLARCDLDGNTAVDSYYFTSSEDSSIQKLNHGK